MQNNTREVVKKSVYFPADVAEFIEGLSQEENRSFTKQVVNLVYLGLNEWYPGWDDRRLDEKS